MAHANQPARDTSSADPWADTQADRAREGTVRICGGDLTLEAALILSEPGSVTRAYGRLRRGDQEAFARIVEHCWPILVRRAGLALPEYVRRSDGPEGIVQEGLLDFWMRVDPKQARVRRRQAASRGRKAKPVKAWKITCREDILKLLSTIVVRKALNRIRAASAEKRREDLFRGGSALDNAVRFAAHPQPGPEEEADFRALCQEALAILPEAGGLRAVGEAWLTTGGTPDEIKDALKISVHPEVIKLKLKTIFAIWQKQLPLVDVRHVPPEGRPGP
jgi:hypothetical protein